VPDRSALRRSRHRQRGRLDADDAAAAALRRLARVTAGPPTAGPPTGLVPAAGERAGADEVVAEEGRDGSGVSGEPVSARHRLSGLGALADRLPLWLRGATLATTGRAAAALVTVLVLAVLATVLLVWWARPQATALPRVTRTGGVSVGVATQPAGPSAVPTVAGPATGSAGVVVHVAGAVHHPGLVTLPAGSRVADAVAAAGGATRKAQLASVNLARLLVDGEQLIVLRRSQVAAGGAVAAPAPGAPGPGGSAGGATGPASGPVDLNTATLEALDGLPGIGPVLAQRILDWRSEHGRFGSVDELSEVSGIGEKTLADLRPEVTV
jgi:competence protein ComEA